MTFAGGQGRAKKLVFIPVMDNTCKWGAGGFVSTAVDVARFGKAMMDGSLMSEQSRELFFRGRSVYSAQGIGAGVS